MLATEALCLKVSKSYQLWTKGSNTCPHIGEIYNQAVSVLAKVKKQCCFRGMSLKRPAAGTSYFSALGWPASFDGQELLVPGEAWLTLVSADGLLLLVRKAKALFVPVH